MAGHVMSRRQLVVYCVLAFVFSATVSFMAASQHSMLHGDSANGRSNRGSSVAVGGSGRVPHQMLNDITRSISGRLDLETINALSVLMSEENIRDMDGLLKVDLRSATDYMPGRDVTRLRALLQALRYNMGRTGQSEASDAEQDQVAGQPDRQKSPAPTQQARQEQGQQASSGKEAVAAKAETIEGQKEPQNAVEAASDDATEAKQRGYANAHFWLSVCSDTISILKNHPHYPDKPGYVTGLNELAFSFHVSSYGARVFGYLVPPKTAEYVFQAKSSGALELSISQGDTLGSQASTIFSNGKGGRSKPIQLQGSRLYPFELLFKQGTGSDSLEVSWAADNEPMRVISGAELALYEPVHAHHEFFEQALKDEVQLLDEKRLEGGLHHHKPVQYYPDAELENVLQTCDYQPSHIKKRKLKRYEAANNYLVEISKLYPADTRSLSSKQQDSKPNPSLTRSEAEKLVKEYLALLNKYRVSKGQQPVELQSIVQVEAKPNKYEKERVRFLLEFDVVDAENKVYRVSRYTFRPSHSAGMCNPRDFQWDKTAICSIIIPVKNQAPWVKHLLMNLARIYRESESQPMFELILVDFESNDMDIEDALRHVEFPYKLIKTTGAFSRALGVQLGIDAVENPNGVAFACDLHLEITYDVIENSRRHCVRGRIGYAPVVRRLPCGNYNTDPNNNDGFWETPGYGLFALARADWDAIGGMNTKLFKFKWGGEDWEMLDRLYEHGYDADRLKEKDFVHYFHTKDGMWTSPGLSFSKDFVRDPAVGDTPVLVKPCDSQGKVMWSIFAAGAIRPLSNKNVCLTPEGRFEGYTALFLKDCGYKAEEHQLYSVTDDMQLQHIKSGECITAHPQGRAVLAPCASGSSAFSREQEWSLGEQWAASTGDCLRYQVPNA